MLNKLKKIIGLLKDQRVSNSAWSIGDAFLFPMLMLIFSPFFISKLGIELFGVWAFVNSLIAGLGVLNFGLSDSMIRFISFYRGKNSDEDLSRIKSQGLIFSLFLTAGIGLLAGMVYGGLYLVNPAPESVYFAVIHQLILWGSLTFSLKLTEQTLLAIPKGYEDYFRSSVISMGSKSIVFFLNLLVIWFGGSLILLFFLTFCVMLLILLTEYFLIRKLFSLNFSFRLTDRTTLKEMQSYGGWSWIQSLNGILAGQADRILVGFLGGPAILGYYSIASMLSMQIHSVFSAGSSWLFPSVSRKLAEGKEVRQTYYKLQLMVSGLGFLLVGSLLLAIDPVIRFWLGQEVASRSLDLIRLFLIFNAFSLTTIVPFFFMNGSGFVKLNTLIGFISSLLNLAGMIAGWFILGPLGFVAGRFVSPVTVSLAGRIVLHKKVLKEKSGILGLLLVIPALLFLGFYWISSVWLVFLNSFLLILFFSSYFYFAKKNSFQESEWL